MRGAKNEEGDEFGSGRSKEWGKGKNLELGGATDEGRGRIWR